MEGVASCWAAKPAMKASAIFLESTGERGDDSSLAADSLVPTMEFRVFGVALWPTPDEVAGENEASSDLKLPLDALEVDKSVTKLSGKSPI